MPGKYFTLVKTLNVCYEKHDCLLYYTKIRFKFISFINLELLCPLVIFPNTSKGINVNNMLLRTRSLCKTPTTDSICSVGDYSMLHVKSKPSNNSLKFK